MNCPKCGSNPVGGIWKSFFECGTFTPQIGAVFRHTVLCGQFAQFRKPLDAQIQQLESERDALKARVKELEDYIKSNVQKP